MNEHEPYIYKQARMEVRPEWGGDFHKFELVPDEEQGYEEEAWMCPQCKSTGAFSYHWSGDRMVGDPGTKVLFYLRYIPIFRCPNCGYEEASYRALRDVDGQADEILEFLGVPKE